MQRSGGIERAGAGTHGVWSWLQQCCNTCQSLACDNVKSASDCLVIVVCVCTHAHVCREAWGERLAQLKQQELQEIAEAREKAAEVRLECLFVGGTALLCERYTNMVGCVDTWPLTLRFNLPPPNACMGCTGGAVPAVAGGAHSNSKGGGGCEHCTGVRILPSEHCIALLVVTQGKDCTRMNPITQRVKPQNPCLDPTVMTVPPVACCYRRPSWRSKRFRRVTREFKRMRHCWFRR